MLQLRSWSEFANLGDEEKQKVYESLLSLARRLLLDRNQGFQVSHDAIKYRGKLATESSSRFYYVGWLYSCVLNFTDTVDE